MSVLIIDDVGTVRSFLKQTLAHLGIASIVEASNGAAGLKAYKDQVQDVVFLDIGLPDMDGKDVLKELKLINPKANIVMISAHSTVDNVKDAIASGAKGFVVKPFSPKKIAAILKKFI
ncbi:response regulator [Algicola sagamiensis]|uniref:response regulator n=1 Tax=Algicola sagamiensis TaxID=163869 RepID=UPI00058E8067|nr:response regulator [Algicola sagamiensis]